MKRTISVIIPALNEEGNIESAVNTVLTAMGDKFSDYEILIFDDGSYDNTGYIADKLAAENNKIQVIHNPKNMGYGYNFKKGVELAKNDYIAMFPGDNEIEGESIKSMFERVRDGLDIIIAYTVNAQIRPLSRRVISRSYTKVMNLLFGLRLKYYNGPPIYKRELIKSIPITTSGFAFLSEILVRAIKSGHKYIEIGMKLRERAYGGSKACKLNNIISVLQTMFRLFWVVNIKRMPLG